MQRVCNIWRVTFSRIRGALTLRVCGLLLLGCAPGPGVDPSTLPPPPSANGYKVSGGDQLRLSFYQDEKLDGVYRVEDSGMLSLPFVGSIPVEGRTLPELRAQIEESLGSGLYRNPTVVVRIEQYRDIYILGEVRNPGAYPYRPNLTLNAAVALAGGYTYRAHEETVGLVLEGNADELVVQAQPALPLRPGDTVRVYERFF